MHRKIAVVLCCFFSTFSIAATFPSTWSPVTTKGGTQRVLDSSTDGSNLGREVVGDSSNAALYIAADGTNFFVRIRLDASPLSSANTLAPFAWGVLIDTDNNSNAYEFSVMVSGKNTEKRIAFSKNSTPLVTGDPSDVAETLLKSYSNTWSGVSQNIQVTTAPSTFNGNPDYFLDIAVPMVDLYGASDANFSSTTPLTFWVGSSVSADSIQTDIAGTTSTPGAGALTTTASDPYYLTTLQPDTDGDTVPDAVEISLGTNVNAVDSDADGINDNIELSASGSSGPFSEVNTDGFGAIDALDSDSDGDCVSDATEGTTAYRNASLPNVDANLNCPLMSPTCNTTTGTCMADCTIDSDCGSATSARICLLATCANGCRGSGGNSCQTGDTCSSSDATPGSCSDTTAPGAPIVNQPAEGSKSTSVAPFVSGTAEPFSTIKIYVDSALAGSTTADGSGAFGYALSASLSESVHTVYATATDDSNNVSVNSATNNFSVDATAPTTPVIIFPANNASINSASPTVSGTAEASSFVVIHLDGTIVGTVTATAGGTFSYSISMSLSESSHSVFVTSSDTTGNVSPDSNLNTFAVDVTVPSAPVVTAPADGAKTSNTAPSIVGTAEALSTVSITVDNVLRGTATANGSGAFTFPLSPALSEASHTISATATDAAGNVSTPSSTNTFLVDATSPNPPTVANPANGLKSNNLMQTVTGSAEAASTVSIYVDGALSGTATATAGGTYAYLIPITLNETTHTVRATATDATGNISSSSSTNTFLIDATPPNAPTVTAPVNNLKSNNASQTVTGSAEASSTVSVYVDGALSGTTTATAGGTYSYAIPVSLSETTHTVYSTATDATGNISSASNVNSFLIDLSAPLAPTVTAPASGLKSNNATQTVTGDAEANTTVSIFVDGTLSGTTAATAAGTYSYLIPVTLSETTHTVYAKATDAAGNVSLQSSTNSFLIDVTPPTAPTVAAPLNNAALKNATPTISGAAEANSTVSIFIDGTSVGTAIATGSSTYTFVVPTALTQATHTVFTRATDASGNISNASSTTTFVVDLTPPVVPLIAGPANNAILNTKTPTLSGSAEGNSTVSIYVDGALAGTPTASAGGNFSLALSSPLTEASHTVHATATDAAGNISNNSLTTTFVVDVTAPLAPTLVAPANNLSTSNTTPLVSGAAEANSTVTIYVDGVLNGTTTATSMGAYNHTISQALPLTVHTVFTRATDAAGNTSAASPTHTFTVTPGAPSTPVVSSPIDNANLADTTPTISGLGDAGSTISVFADGQLACTTTATGGGTFTCDSTLTLAQGTHIIIASSTTPYGTSGHTPLRSIVIDSVAPPTPVVIGPTHVSSTATPTVTGTGEPGTTITVSFDSTLAGTATVASNGTWSYTTVNALSVASHSVSATSKDAAGNVSLSSNVNAFAVVGSAGVPTLSAPLDNAFISQMRPPITGTSTANAQVNIFFDGVLACTVLADNAGAYTCVPSTALSQGLHEVFARVGANTSSTRSFTVDTVAPSVPSLTGPAVSSSTDDTTPTLTGMAESLSTVTLFVDGMSAGTTTASLMGTFRFDVVNPLALTTHVVTATSTDRANNISVVSSSISFTVIAPNGAPIIYTPVRGGISNDNTPALSGHANAGDSIEALLDGQVACTTTATLTGAWACSPSISAGDGIHAASARVLGAPVIAASATFLIDTSVPNVPVVVSPANLAYSGVTPTLSGTAEANARVSISIDGNLACVRFASALGAWSCTPAGILSMGAHQISATAGDSAQNVSAASNSQTFIVDTIPPAVPTLMSPASMASIDTANPMFTGSAESGSVVTVVVDGQAVCTATAAMNGYFSCTASLALAIGAHNVQVRAKDAAGNESSLSSSSAFTILSAPPAAPIIITPADGTATNTPSTTIAGTALAASTVNVKDGANIICTVGADVVGNWSCTAILSEGPHTLTATAEALGVTSMASAPIELIVDTMAPTITGADGAQLDARNPQVNFGSSEDAVYECSIDGDEFELCGPPLAVSGLSPGSHTLAVRATDGAGNVTNRTIAFTIPATSSEKKTGGCNQTEMFAPMIFAVGLFFVSRRKKSKRFIAF